MGTRSNARIFRSYYELCAIESFEDRFEYLRIAARIGDETFCWKRWLNQVFYTSEEWKSIRNAVILRDAATDLSMKDSAYEIKSHLIIHHMVPITEEDILTRSKYLLDPEYLVCTSLRTHNLLHYSNESIKPNVVERSPNDTCPWKK